MPAPPISCAWTLAEYGGENLMSDKHLQGAVLVIAAILFVAILASAAITIVIKRRKILGLGKDYSPLPVEVPALPVELLKRNLPDTPNDPVERHRRTIAVENRARSEACRLAAEYRDAPSAHLWLLAGPGPLGAAAMAAARHLDALGLETTVQQMSFADKLGPEAARERKTMQAARLRLLESPAPRALTGVSRLVIGIDEAMLSEARRGDLNAILHAAEQEGIPVERMEEFSPHFSPPPPQDGDVVIPVPEVTLTREESRQLDALAQQHYSIAGVALMENAGYWAAREAWRAAHDVAESKGESRPRVAVVCGKGNNGGDGFVIARLLQQWGLPGEVFVLGMKNQVSDDARKNLQLFELDRKVAPIIDDSQWPQLEAALADAHLIVDAVLGTGMTGPVRGPAAEAIARMNAAREKGAWILAVDCPSGLDCNSGEPLGACVTADLTVTFAGMKAGFTKGQGADHCGRIVVADIGLPREIYRRRKG
ncbi:MAG: NAD(P)H-hydrate epimerase [Planctomycetes bacterium]|nr:NAD(P)H-hydrate epimerase [Planctomycetota bacterium]